MSKNPELNAAIQRLNRLSDDLEALIHRRHRAMDARATDAAPRDSGSLKVTPLDPRRGSIPDGRRAVDGRGMPLAFGPSDPKLGEHTIEQFNALGRRLRGEKGEKR